MQIKFFFFYFSLIFKHFCHLPLFYYFTFLQSIQLFLCFKLVPKYYINSSYIYLLFFQYLYFIFLFIFQYFFTFFVFLAILSFCLLYIYVFFYYIFFYILPIYTLVFSISSYLIFSIHFSTLFNHLQKLPFHPFIYKSFRAFPLIP